MNNAPDTLIDTDAANNEVAEGALNGTIVGISALATDADGDTISYSLTDNAGGRFAIDATSGTVSVADGTLLDFEAAATHSITVQADDGNGGIITQNFTIDVTNVNEAPVLNTNLLDQTVAEGATASYTFNATDFSDVDGDVLSYSASLVGGGALPSFISFNSATRTFDFTAPANADVGSYQIEVTASDGTLSATDSFELTVSDVNQNPVNLRDDSPLLNTVDEDATNGTIVGLTARADDPDGDTLTYSLVNDEGGRFGIDASTGVVTVLDETLLDFESDADGNYIIRVRAEDASGTGIEQDFTIKINDANETPSAVVDNDSDANVVDEGAAAGTVVNVTGVATDVDAGANGTLTYSLQNNAGGRFTIDGSSGVVTVASGAVFDYSANANHDIIIRATDGGGLFTEETFTINVNAAPGPVIDSNNADNRVNTSDTNGTIVDITGLAVDPDGGVLTYSLSNNAGGRFAIDNNTGVVTIANAAAITGSPNSFTIDIEATDARGLSSVQSFTIDVNRAPIQNLGLLDRIAHVGNPHEYNINIPNPAGDIAFEDPDGDALTYTVISAPPWLNFNATTQTFTGTPAAGDVGTTAITVRATDPFGAFADDTFNIEVRNTRGLQGEIFVNNPLNNQINGGAGIGEHDGIAGQNTASDEAHSIAGYNASTNTIDASRVVGNFVSSSVNYGPSNTLSEFLDNDFASLDDVTLNGATSNNATEVLRQVVRYSGILEVNASGIHKFAVYSDDGFVLRIDGNVVSSFTGNRAPRTTEAALNLSAGDHTVELIYWENGGGQRIDFYSTANRATAIPATEALTLANNSGSQPPALDSRYQIVDDTHTRFTPGIAFFDAPTSMDTVHHDVNNVVEIDEATPAFQAILTNAPRQNGRTVYYTLDDNNYDNVLKETVRQVTREYESVADIQFIEGINPETGVADLEFTSATDGYAFTNGAWIQGIGSDTATITLSENFYDYQETLDVQGSTQGSYTRLALLHEVGHFLGLDEPNINLLPDAEFDSSAYTVLSYNQIRVADNNTPYGSFTRSLGQLDIGALQYLYGRNPEDANYVAPFEHNGIIDEALQGADAVEFFTTPTTAPAPASGEFIVLNGVPYSFVVGADPSDPTQIEFDTLGNMLAVLTDRLNNSTDPRISQATYELVNSNTIKITTRAGQDLAELYRVADNLAGLRNFISVQGGTAVNDFAAQSNFIAEDGDANRNNLLGSGSVTVAGQSRDDILLSPTNIRPRSFLHLATNPLAGETLSIDDGNNGSLDFVLVANADPLNPFEISIGNTVQDTLDNIVGKLNGWVESFGETNNSFVIRSLDFSWEGDTLILEGRTSSPVLDYRDELATFSTTFSGAQLSSPTLDNALSRGINTDFIANNAFYGTIDNVQARYTGVNQVALSVEVGDVTYVATVDDTTIRGNDLAVRLASERNGFFDIELHAGSGVNVNSEADADIFADRINAALSGISFYQERQVLNYQPAGDLRDSTLSVTLNDFDNPVFFDDVQVTIADELYSNDGTQIVITANGSRFIADLNNDTNISTNQTLTLVNENDRNETITLRHSGDTIDLITARDAENFESLLRAALPFGGFLNRETIDFQVNADSSEQLQIDIQAVTSEALFRDVNSTINIRTQEDAQAAFAAIRNAIDEITSRRADLGAFQAQTDSILDNLEDAIINQTNANAVLTDTDVARVSTEFATQLAKTQATINSIASANRLHSDSLISLIESLSDLNG